MPTLQDKYAELITATQASASGVAVRTQDNVLYIDGVVPTGEAKDKLWNIYDRIDPDFRGGDELRVFVLKSRHGSLMVVDGRRANASPWPCSRSSSGSMRRAPASRAAARHA